MGRASSNKTILKRLRKEIKPELEIWEKALEEKDARIKKLESRIFLIESGPWFMPTFIWKKLLKKICRLS